MDGMDSGATSIEEVEFQSCGVRLRAGLMRPRNSPLADASGRLPCVVMAHGLGGTRAAGLEPFMQRFAAAGLGVLCFDYRGFGLSEGRPRQVVSVPMQLEDWAAAIAHARSLPDIDPARIATWGSSFSGSHSVAVAVRDGRIAAVVSQGAMFDGLASLVNLVKQAGVGHALKLTGWGLADAINGALGRPRVTVRVVGQPGTRAALTTPDSEPGYLRLTPPEWVNEISTSWALTLATYRPNLMTPRLPCPALFCIATGDVIVPPSAMEDGARRAPDKVTVKRYDAKHFEIYIPPVFESVVTDQAAFLVKTLAPVPA